MQQKLLLKCQSEMNTLVVNVIGRCQGRVSPLISYLEDIRVWRPGDLILGRCQGMASWGFDASKMTGLRVTGEDKW